jgi:hypothetical protein
MSALLKSGAGGWRLGQQQQHNAAPTRRWAQQPRRLLGAPAEARIRLCRGEDVQEVADICAQVFIQEQFRQQLAEADSASLSNIVQGYTDRIRADMASKLDAALLRKHGVRAGGGGGALLAQGAPRQLGGGERRTERRRCCCTLRRPRRPGSTAPTGGRCSRGTLQHRRPRRRSSGEPAALPSAPGSSAPTAAAHAQASKHARRAAAGGRCSAGLASGWSPASWRRTGPRAGWWAAPTWRSCRWEAPTRRQPARRAGHAALRCTARVQLGKPQPRIGAGAPDTQLAAAAGSLAAAALACPPNSTGTCRPAPAPTHACLAPQPEAVLPPPLPSSAPWRAYVGSPARPAPAFCPASCGSSQAAPCSSLGAAPALPCRAFRPEAAARS